MKRNNTKKKKTDCDKFSFWGLFFHAEKREVQDFAFSFCFPIVFFFYSSTHLDLLFVEEAIVVSEKKREIEASYIRRNV